MISSFAFLNNPQTRIPSQRVKTLSMGYEKEIGVQAPLGFWDPLGFLADAEQKDFDRLRASELKHGRVAMLAVLGHIVTTKGDRLPGDIAFGLPFSQVHNGLAAFKDIPLAGTLQLFFFVGLMEAGFSQVEKQLEEYCNRNMKARGWSEEKIRQKKAIELNNGRAAQMGIAGLVTHELLNNDPYVLNSLLGFPVPFNQ
eukprot:CAMPEP_0173151198 /NCGR_PEP_ID=MMETSP1105-20130129/11430_1 /TAXON_ID=2985 /ORGANISM="Ochromonas sp., Strain BG-1" /LENGTH=197 /DNA_ID=CAMNT_0014066513 /DNA_START=119 /DNA_END=712 /DNA_ORIENTATION=-